MENEDEFQWLEQLHARVLLQKNVFYAEEPCSPPRLPPAGAQALLPPLLAAAEPRGSPPTERALESWQIGVRAHCFPRAVAPEYWHQLHRVYLRLKDVVATLADRCAAAEPHDRAAEEFFPKVVECLVGFLLHDIVPFYLSWHATEISAAEMLSTHHQDVELLGSICASVLELLVYVRERVADEPGEALPTYLETLVTNKLSTASECGRLLWRFTKVSSLEDVITHHRQIEDALTLLRWLVERGPQDAFERCIEEFTKTDPPLIGNILRLLEMIRAALEAAARKDQNALLDQDVTAVPRLLSVQNQLEQFLHVSARVSTRLRSLYIVRGVIEAVLDAAVTRTPANKRQALHTLAAICSEPEGAVYLRANPKFLERIMTSFNERCESWLELIKIFFQLDNAVSEPEQVKQRVNKIRELPRGIVKCIFAGLIDFAEAGAAGELVCPRLEQTIADVIVAIWTTCDNELVSNLLAEDTVAEADGATNTHVERLLSLAFRNSIYSEALMVANAVSSANHLGVECLQPNFARPASAFSLAERTLLHANPEEPANIKSALRLLAGVIMNGVPCVSEIRATLCRASVCESQKTWLDCVFECALVCARSGAWFLVNCCVYVLLLWSSSLRTLAALEDIAAQKKVSISLWENLNFDKFVMLKLSDSVVEITRLMCAANMLTTEWSLFLVTLLGRSVQIIDAAEIYRSDDVFKVFIQSEIDVLATTIPKIEEALGQDTIRACFTKLTDLNKLAVPIASLADSPAQPALCCQFKLLVNYIKSLATLATHSKVAASTTILPTADKKTSMLSQLAVGFTPEIYVKGLIYHRLAALKDLTHAFAARAKQKISHITPASTDVSALVDLLADLSGKVDRINERLDFESRVPLQDVAPRPLGSRAVVELPPAYDQNVAEALAGSLPRAELINLIGCLSTQLTNAQATIAHLAAQIGSVKRPLAEPVQGSMQVTTTPTWRSNYIRRHTWATADVIETQDSTIVHKFAESGDLAEIARSPASPREEKGVNVRRDSEMVIKEDNESELYQSAKFTPKPEPADSPRRVAVFGDRSEVQATECHLQQFVKPVCRSPFVQPELEDFTSDAYLQSYGDRPQSLNASSLLDFIHVEDGAAAARQGEQQPLRQAKPLQESFSSSRCRRMSASQTLEEEYEHTKFVSGDGLRKQGDSQTLNSAVEVYMRGTTPFGSQESSSGTPQPHGVDLRNEGDGSNLLPISVRYEQLASCSADLLPLIEPFTAAELVFTRLPPELTVTSGHIASPLRLEEQPAKPVTDSMEDRCAVDAPQPVDAVLIVGEAAAEEEPGAQLDVSFERGPPMPEWQCSPDFDLPELPSFPPSYGGEDKSSSAPLFEQPLPPPESLPSLIPPAVPPSWNVSLESAPAPVRAPQLPSSNAADTSERLLRDYFEVSVPSACASDLPDPPITSSSVSPLTTEAAPPLMTEVVPALLTEVEPPPITENAPPVALPDVYDSLDGVAVLEAAPPPAPQKLILPLLVDDEACCAVGIGPADQSTTESPFPPHEERNSLFQDYMLPTLDDCHLPPLDYFQ